MQNTQNKILMSAEILFSEQGFASTSLREITRHAGVNLAAVNYHFGNKQQLIVEVFQHHMDSLNKERLQRLDKITSSGQPVFLEEVLRALIYPALKLSRDNEGGGDRFVKLIARIYAESNEDLHAFLVNHYGHVIKRFASTIQAILPDMPAKELRWQLDFVIGALTYVMADFSGHFSHKGDPQPGVINEADRLVSFAAAGIRSFQPSRAQKDLFSMGGNVTSPAPLKTKETGRPS